MTDLTQRQEDVLKALQKGMTVFRHSTNRTWFQARSLFGESFQHKRTIQPLLAAELVKETFHGYCYFLELTKKGKDWPS